jgi:hypothetical protein
MRTTQFIGLTRKAHDFVQNLKQLDSDTHTCGMFGEEIPLRKWESPPEFHVSYPNDKRIPVIREVVFATPWSSGPMIFTCLEFDYLNGGKTEFFQWVTNPLLKGGQEYDEEIGELWV